MKITLSKQKVRGELKWVVSRRENGRRRRTHFTSKSTAEAEVARLKQEFKDAGDGWLDLTSLERNDLVRIHRECQQKNIALDRLLKLATEQPSSKSPLLPVAITELLETKEKAGRSDAYVSALKSALNQFAAGKSVAIAAVTFSQVEGFLDSKPLASRSTLRSRLSTLFKFAVRRGYRVDNPCERLEPVTVVRGSPDVFTPEQLEKSLQWLRSNARHALPWFVLTTCCGLRPEESEKTRKADIHFDEGWIKIEAQTTKVRQRRVVYPKPEAMALLKRCMRGGRLPIGPNAAKRALAGARWKNNAGIQTKPGLRQALGWKHWPKDITRHTAASYWLADCESTAAVARYLGHSETILLRHYAALVTKEQARQFWRQVQQALQPATRRPSKVSPSRRRRKLRQRGRIVRGNRWRRSVRSIASRGHPSTV